MQIPQKETIAAISTGNGGAISLIRVSGENAIAICDSIFLPRSGKKLCQCSGFTLHFGTITDTQGRKIDEVLVSLFRAPRSYTGEDMVEISCHASDYIQQRILSLLIEHSATAASAGEFTQRAYLNGKLDLVQAEAVAELIASSSESAHRLAMNQMKGGYSREFSLLRENLLQLISLLELELDFSEEEVEFADRTQLRTLLETIHTKIESLTASFKHGNAIKNGIPVAIVGKPNAGKSTLLNALLGEERAIVSDIAGTTRDLIEETLNISGILFRFIDTAGLRHTTDKLENMGIERTRLTVSKAELVLFVAESEDTASQIATSITDLQLQPWQQLILLINKTDRQTPTAPPLPEVETLFISAKTAAGLPELRNRLAALYRFSDNEVIITNTRHWELLTQAATAANRALEGLNSGTPSDLIVQDIREIIHHIGQITGEISTDDILHNIFANFCIGK